jgi:segregation and condensation protein B
MDDLQAKIEALLFIYGEPVKIKTLADKLAVSEEVVKETLNQLQNELTETKRGLALILLDDKAQLTTKPSLSSFIEKVIQEELDTELTPASLETLAIIAYLGPCSRAEIDYLRGVNSSFILRNLAIRGLIERKPDPQKINAFSYRISFNFLKHLGIDSLQKLPDYEKYKNLIKSYLKKDHEASPTPS